LEFQSTRERIVEILRRTQRPLRVEEIAMILGLEPSRKREIYEHLTHIAKTIRRQSSGKEVLIMELPKCRDCGFIFKNLKKPKEPSRCPKCKSERIDPPRFKIVLISNK